LKITRENSLSSRFKVYR